MKISIQMKFLVLCILLVLLTTIGISVTYYVLTKQDKHRESQQRIRIAFDIILNDLTKQVNDHRARFHEFLQQNPKLGMTTYIYKQDTQKIADRSFITSYVGSIADKIKDFGSMISADQVILYGSDRRLLVVYQRHKDQETVGGYVISETEDYTYLPMDDMRQLSLMLRENEVLPEMPLPPGVKAEYEGGISNAISADLFREGRKVGIMITAPIRHRDDITGILVGKVFYTQRMLEEYASLSKTAVNLFAGELLSTGTLPAQEVILSEAMQQMISCEDLFDKNITIEAAPVTFDDQEYYQGQCAFRNTQGIIGAITVSLSQDIEKREIRKIVTAVILISGIAIVIALSVSVLSSRRAIQAIHNLVRVIGAAAEGDLRPTVIAVGHDEIGLLGENLNQMIDQLRTISGQVKNASATVNRTADNILRKMDALVFHIQEQSASVDSTTTSVEQINQFIDLVAQDTADLLETASLILVSIQQTQASISEVNVSIGYLTTNVHLISTSIDQVNQSAKRISGNTGQLEGIARQTETEMQRIDQSLRDVSQNATHAQQMAQKTMEAVTRGQGSVDASIQGMGELKEVVANTASVIQEVNSWGEQVSAILDMVDEITEQTTLLALNASIISAQAGVHGKGFAVVAGEIKNLATRTKASTAEIVTLVQALQKKTAEGVKNTAEGIVKAEQSVKLARAVKEALNTVLEHATQSSNRATDTAQVIQQTVDSSQIIRASMNSVTEMVSKIKADLQNEEQEVEQAVRAVENISGMVEQVNRASLEQKKAAQQIEENMEDTTEKFSTISKQTATLRQNFNQIVAAMYTIESTTTKILQNTATLSEDTVKDLVQQSEILQRIVNVFKVN